jgi:hypothetical protein
MSKYLSELKTTCVDDLAASGRGIWRIDEPFLYQSDVLGGRVLIIEAGFLTDYASVPRVPLAYLLFGDTCHKGAVVHDWLYHHHDVCSEETANLVLLEAAEAEGVPRWRRRGLYLGVKLGGRSSWDLDGMSNGHSLVNGVIV